MSAVVHIKEALAQTVFANPRLKAAMEELIDSIDQDLDRTGYQPSSQTKARLQALVGAVQTTTRGRAAPEDDEEEERDTQRLS